MKNLIYKEVRLAYLYLKRGHNAYLLARQLHILASMEEDMLKRNDLLRDSTELYYRSCYLYNKSTDRILNATIWCNSITLTVLLIMIISKII